MSFGESQNWESWKDIKGWCEKNGFGNIVARMELNNDCWMSSGEFGRNQVVICDNLRHASDENEAIEIAQQMDKELSENFGLY